MHSLKLGLPKSFIFSAFPKLQTTISRERIFPKSSFSYRLKEHENLNEIMRPIWAPYPLKREKIFATFFCKKCISHPERVKFRGFRRFGCHPNGKLKRSYPRNFLELNSKNCQKHVYWH